MTKFLGVVMVFVAGACSSRVDVDQTEWSPSHQTLTVCSVDGDAMLERHIRWAADYWWERGYDVEWVPGPYCLVRVQIRERSHVPDRDCKDAKDGWCPGEVAIETHRTWNGEPRIDGFAPATITIRETPWRRADAPRREWTMSHELGHSLGLHHSAAMPMRSCDEFCFEDAEVQAWYDEVQGVAL